MSFTRGWRFFYQLALLGALLLLDSISEPVFLDVTAVALIIGPVASWTVAAILIWTSRQAPDVITLRQRADDAVTLALASTGFCIAGSVVFARLLGINVPGRPIVVILGYAALLVLVPALTWLTTWHEVWMPMVRGAQKDEPRE